MENMDEELWRIAKKRVAFKKQLVSYIIVNGFLWAIWYFTRGHSDLDDMDGRSFPWPIWSTLGWGIGLAFSYFNAFHYNRSEDVAKEYQKLKDREGK